MPTIEEYFLSVITQLGVKRSSIASAIRDKGVSVDNNATFSDFPSLINSISTGGGGSNVYYHSDNSLLADSYTGEASMMDEYNGTYSKVTNTYHRGFNVYRHTTANRQFYLIAADDNGYVWKVVYPMPSEDATVHWTLPSNSTLGPVGTYTGGDMGSFVINGSSSSSSSTEGSSASGGDYSSDAPDTLYITGTYGNTYDGRYVKQSGSLNGYAYYRREESYYSGSSTKYYLFVVNTTDGKHAWMFNYDTSVSNTSTYFETENGYMSTTVNNQSEALQSYPHGEMFHYIVMGGSFNSTHTPSITDTYSGGSC